MSIYAVKIEACENQQELQAVLDREKRISDQMSYKHTHHLEVLDQRFKSWGIDDNYFPCAVMIVYTDHHSVYVLDSGTSVMVMPWRGLYSLPFKFVKEEELKAFMSQGGNYKPG